MAYIWIPQSTIPLNQKIAFFFLIIISISAESFGQVEISGSVKNKKGEALAFANIGIPKTVAGTLSEDDGSFALQIPEELLTSTLFIAALGYETEKLIISDLDLSKPIHVTLVEKEISLSEFTISSDKIKPKEAYVGNGKSFLLSGLLFMDTVSAGSAMAIMIDPKDEPELPFLKGATLRIAMNKFPEFKIRLRVMDVDVNNESMPGKDLVQANVIQTSSMDKGWLDFDLSPFALELNEPFYLVFEWILSKDDRLLVQERYNDFIEQYPDRVSYDTVMVEGEEIVTMNIGRVLAGTIFGTTPYKEKNKKFKTVARENSFSEWENTSGILSAKALFSNTLSPVALDKTEDCLSIKCIADTQIDYLLQEYPAPGIQLSMSKVGQMVYSKAGGYRDVGHEIPATLKTQFRIASLSKTMAAFGLYYLNDSSILDFTKPIGDFLDVPREYAAISAQQLANHTGRVPDYLEVSLDEIFIQEHFDRLKDALPLFIDRPITPIPAGTFYYSSYGYLLLGAVMEEVSQNSFLDFMSGILWEPAGMNSTSGDIKDENQPEKSKFYLINGQEAKPYDLSYSHSSGGLISTSEDLVKFGEFLLSQNYFDSDAFKSSLIETGTSGVFYGLGWYMTKDAQGKDIYFHAGELPSSGAFILVEPEGQHVISLLANGPILYDEEDYISTPILELLELISN